MSYRDAFRPCSRVSSGEKNNTFKHAMILKLQLKIWKQTLAAV